MPTSSKPRRSPAPDLAPDPASEALRSAFGVRSGLAACALAAFTLHPAFAAPVTVALRAISSQSHAGPGYLGIDVRDVPEDQLSALHLASARGAIIIRVDHDGPAGKMGLREHDVVIAMNGSAVEGEEPLRRMLHDTAPGRMVTLLIMRDGQQLTVSAQMADRAEVDRQAWLDHLGGGAQAPATGLPSGDLTTANAALPAPPPVNPRYSRSFLGTLLTSPTYTGATLEKMAPQLAGFFGLPARSRGMLVCGVDPNSPAAMAGLRAGDVVLRANTRSIQTLSDWTKAVKEAKGSPLSIVVIRDHAEHTLLLTPDLKRHVELIEPVQPASTRLTALWTTLHL